MNQKSGVHVMDYIKVLPQYILPQHFLTSIVYRLTRIKQPLLKNNLIGFFIRLFQVEMETSIKKQAEEFQHFNDFFTRELLANARPIANSTITSPVDGYLSQFGKIKAGQLIQAKGHSYTVENLLAGDKEKAFQFENGDFSTLYLSPKNYHRIHMPVSGKLINMTFVPGKLFAVNQHTTHVVPNLFAKNERLIIHFETELGPMCLIMVGAIFVGSMDTVWQGQITPAAERQIKQWNYGNENKTFNKGEEIGRFNMGSTVILLFPEDSIQWNTELKTNQEIIMGQALSQ